MKLIIYLKIKLYYTYYHPTMDLKQRKLNRSEWTSIEIAVSNEEIDILKMIILGYSDVNIKLNKHNSIFTFLKIEYSEKMEDYLFNTYLRERVDKIEEEIAKNHDTNYKKVKVNSKIRINSADKIRLEKYDDKEMHKNDIYEFILLVHIEKMLFYKKSINLNNKLFNF